MATDTFAWVDALFAGQLAKRLKRWRVVEGLSIRDVADEINKRLPDGREVHFTTVGRWCAERGYVAERTKRGAA